MTQAVVGEGEHIIYVDFISNLIRRDKNYCRFRFCQGNCKKWHKTLKRLKKVLKNVFLLETKDIFFQYK